MFKLRDISTFESGSLSKSNGVALSGAAFGWRHVRQIGLTLIAFIICVAALTREPSMDVISPADFDSPVANREIRAMFYFESTDLQRTQEARDLEMAKVPDYYRINATVVQRQLRLLDERLEKLREEQQQVADAIVQALKESAKEQTPESIVTRVVSAHATSLKESPEWDDFPEPDLLALWLSPDTSSLPARIFVESGDDENPVSSVEFASDVALTFTKCEIMGNLASDALEYVLMSGVRPDALPLSNPNRKIVILRDRAASDLAVTSELTLPEVPESEQAGKDLSDWLTSRAQRAARDMATPDRWARIHDGAQALAQPLITPTIQEDKVYTEGARVRAAEAVPAVLKEVEAGEIIQDRGKRWTKQSRSDVQAYMQILSSEDHPVKQVLNTLTAHVILVLLVFWGLHKRVHFQEKGDSTPPQTAFNLGLLLLCATLVTGRIISYFEPTGYILPVAATGILFAILVGPQRAALFGALAAALVSAQYQYNWRLLLVAGAMTIAGAFSTYGVRKRSDMTAASLVATLVGVLAVGAAILATDTLFGDIFFRRIFMIILNGLLCLLAVPSLLPWLEKLFGITTDMQLLEYSDLNNHLLRKLAMSAPATYAHSLLLGQIAEAAANAIGANGLHARVCAYYHDIGKQFKPEHFTENQANQKNIHDTLSPLVSARIIRQHVVEGVREAQENKLPQPIIDGILEHHGTCKISFFYDQAVRESGADEVNELDFRYPGPKPQSPETAILMICDASESGVRSLENPTFEAVQQFVGSIIRARAEDNQFEDCNLTLRQLSQIRDVVARALVNAMHTRIAYPKQNGKEPQDIPNRTMDNRKIQKENIIPISGG